ncbi:MAG: cation transporter [Chitinophagaceae bacterium]
MTHHYTISGMTCNSCVAKVKSQLLSTAGIDAAEVQLEAPQATITMQKHIALTELQAAVSKAGRYTIASADATVEMHEKASWFVTYKPVLLIFAYITGVTILINALQHSFNWMTWMQNFMAGFFLVFSFFKMLDVKSFADSYSSYDILAKKWNGWGYIYPFAELALGIAYLVIPMHLLTSLATFMIMSVSMVGVLQAVFSKRKIQCACLGAVFNLPMSTITIIEDGLMIAMSAIMLLRLIIG